MAKNPPYNAGDAGWIPGQGPKIPTCRGELNLRATTAEAPTSWSLQVATKEAVHRKENFRMPQLRLDGAK